MDRRRFIVGGMAAVAAATTLQARANGGGVEPDCDHPGHDDPECPHEHHLGILGSWYGEYVDGDSGVMTLLSFTRGHVVIESARPAIKYPGVGKMLATAGQGAWKAVDKASAEVLFRVLLQSAQSGDQFGVEDVRLKVTIDDKHRQLTGTYESQAMDFAGNVIATSSGKFGATRIKV